MKQHTLLKLFFSLSLTVCCIPTPTFAANQVAGALEPTQWLNNFELVGVNISGVTTAASTLAGKIKDYGLDPIATRMANSLINRAMSDTLTWMKSGFQGGGPGFIVNPDAYFKNVANQQIRIQLDSLNKSDSQFKSALSVSLIKNIRDGRSNIGAQLQTTLFDTVQQETCAGNNLQKIAETQIDTNLSTTNDTSGLSRDEKITKLKKDLYDQFCTAAAKSNPVAKAKLQSCVDSGSCGSWGSLFASYDPKNTLYGQTATVLAVVPKSAEQAVATQKTKVSGGIIPKEVCKVRLQVDETDNPYPEGQGPCVEWNIQTPVEAVVAKAQQAVTGAFDKFNNVHGFADLLGSIAENYLTNQVEKMFYSGLSSALSSNSNPSNLNTSYDNLLSVKSSALPKEAITVPVSNIATTTADIAAQLQTATRYCQNPPTDKKAAISGICNHLTSITKTNSLDKDYMTQMTSYLSSVTLLESCSQSLPGNNYADKVNERKVKISTYGNVDEVKSRLAKYDKAVQKLSAIIVTVVESGDKAASEALLEYTNVATDDSIMIMLGQEKIASAEYLTMKRETDGDRGKLNEELGSCEQSKCAIIRTPSCPVETQPANQYEGGA